MTEQFLFRICATLLIFAELNVRILFCLLISVLPAHAGLEKYPQLVKADDPSAISAPPRRGVRITYLGTNAYLFETRETVLLVDPYFSRQNLFRMALQLQPVLQTELVAHWLRDHPKIDAVLITHGHIDHLCDAPQIARETGAKLIASSTSVKLAESLGVPAKQTRAVRAGRTESVQHALIHVLPAQHDRLLGAVPFNGPQRRLPPQTIGDWVTGDPLAFVIEIGGQRIFINSGGRPNDVISARWSGVDLAILGVAAGDSIRAVPGAWQLRPRLRLASHQTISSAHFATVLFFSRSPIFPRCAAPWRPARAN